ncbi:MAG: cytochrome c-type biogenesis protein CcmH [Clostridia bacterium]|nr:cytochrome c-type biogenesis protein CcmH [Clostridia bacterium]
MNAVARDRSRPFLLVLLGIFLLASAGGAAQASRQPQPPDAAALEREARAIEALLRCPVCEGQSVAESNTSVALDIKEDIRRQLAAGRTRREILDDYAARYGDWILNAPPARGFALAAWLVPVLALLCGVVVLGLYVRGRGTAGGTAAGVMAASGDPGAETAEDRALEEELLRRLRDEL